MYHLKPKYFLFIMILRTDIAEGTLNTQHVLQVL